MDSVSDRLARKIIDDLQIKNPDDSDASKKDRQVFDSAIRDFLAPIGANVPPPEGMASTSEMNDIGMRVGHSHLMRDTVYGVHRRSQEFMLHTLLPKIVNTEPIIVSHLGRGMMYVTTMDSLRIRRPMNRETDGVLRQLTLKETQARRMTMMNIVTVNLRCRIYHLGDPDPVTDRRPARLVEDTKYTNITIMEIPAMSFTDASHFEKWVDIDKFVQYQGMFAINGHGRGGVTLSELINNRVMITRKNKKSDDCVAELRCRHEAKLRTTATLKIFIKKKSKRPVPVIQIKLPYPYHPLPITVFFRLHGAKTISDMVDMIVSGQRKAKIGSSVADDIAMFVRRILFNCPGVTDPDCNALKATREELLVWTVLNCSKESDVVKQAKRTNEQIAKTMSHLLINEGLVHLCFEGEDPNSKEVLSRKMLSLGLVIHELLLVYLKHKAPHCIDDGEFVHLVPIGNKIGLKIRQLWRAFINGYKAAVMRAAENGTYFYPPTTIHELYNAFTRVLRKCMAKGDFSADKESITQAGITRVVDHSNQSSRNDDMMTIRKPIDPKTAPSAPRQMRPSTLGIFDPNSPDSRTIGLTLRYVMMCIVRSGHGFELIRRLVKAAARGLNLLFPLKTSRRKAPTLIVINGATAMRTRGDGSALLKVLQTAREQLAIPPDVSFCLDTKLGQLIVDADAGAAFRPVFVISRLKEAREISARFGNTQPHLVMIEMLRVGAVQYISKVEERTHRIASRAHVIWTDPTRFLSPFHYLELEASMTVFGPTAAGLPFANRCQAPRVSFQCTMQHQGFAGVSPVLEAAQIDSQKQTLLYPQKPLVETASAKIMRENDRPCRQMMMLAIMQWHGLNQEDAIIMFKSSVERGMGCTVHQIPVWATESRHGDDTEIICDPRTISKLRRRSRGSAHALDSDGIAFVGAKINPGDIVIGRVLKHSLCFRSSDGSVETRQIFTDCSVTYKGIIPRSVLKVRITTKCGQRIVIVDLACIHRLMAGDKVVSNGGQKSSVGLLASQTDSPFMEDGTTTDAIMAMHGFTSRMTISQMIEMLNNKIASITGKIGDATAFREYRLVDALQQMRDAAKNHATSIPGTSGCSWEEMYSGETGMPIGKVFVAPCAMLILRHQSRHKSKARGARGAVSALTRQPVQSHANHDKPMRCGNMENDKFNSIGTPYMMQRMMGKHSDGEKIPLCGKCGSICKQPTPDADFRLVSSDQPECPRCKTSEHVTICNAPYGMVLMKQNLMAAGIDMALLP